MSAGLGRISVPCLAVTGAASSVTSQYQSQHNRRRKLIVRAQMLCAERSAVRKKRAAQENGRQHDAAGLMQL